MDDFAEANAMVSCKTPGDLACARRSNGLPTAGLAPTLDRARRRTSGDAAVGKLARDHRSRGNHDVASDVRAGGDAATLLAERLSQAIGALESISEPKAPRLVKAPPQNNNVLPLFAASRRQR